MSDASQSVEHNRAIVHVDMDAFYAAVEQRDAPRYRGCPVIVGGLGRRGVVSAASYEARVFGVHSAMPMARARRLCPDAVYLAPRMERYREVSAELFTVFHQITPLVEGISVDEAWLDVTASRRLFGDIEAIGRQLKRKVREQTGLVASIGMAPNKFLAKLASDYGKPDGFCRIHAAAAAEFLAPLPVSRLWGIGPRSTARLGEAGIVTIADLDTASDITLQRVLGRAVPHYRALARGIDPRKVVPERAEKSISHEHTFDQDIDAFDHIQRSLLGLSEAVGTRLRRRRLGALTVVLKVRSASWRTFTRRRTRAQPTASTGDIYRTVMALMRDWRRDHGLPVRLLGVAVSGLARLEQDRLFEQRGAGVDTTLDEIRARFGGDAITRGSLIDTDPP